ncbi:MAG: acyl-CoA thioesterase, partial [Steroidobacteraceae bacterium]
MNSEFSAVLAALRPGDGGLQVTVPADWLQGRTVFGGLQMALAVRAMRSTMGENERALPLRSAQITFVGPVAGDTPVQLEAEVLRQGRSTVHARCDLLQDGAVGATVVAIFGVARASQFLHELPAPKADKGPEDATLPSMDPRLA